MRTERILIVEPEEGIRKHISEQLKIKGYETSEAGNAKEALLSLASAPHDLIITDIPLNGVNGIELCRKIRRKSATRNTPVIFYSETDDDYLILNAMNAGANSFISKSASTTFLSKIINDLLMNLLVEL